MRTIEMNGPVFATSERLNFQLTFDDEGNREWSRGLKLVEGVHGFRIPSIAELFFLRYNPHQETLTKKITYNCQASPKVTCNERAPK